MSTHSPSSIVNQRSVRPALAVWARWLPLAVELLAMVAYAGQTLYQITLPGLYYDEAFDVVPAMQILLGQPTELARGVGLPLFGRQWPMMIGDYWGVVSTYAVLPLLAVFGIGVVPVRLWPIGAGIVAIWLTARLGRRLYGPAVGLLAAVLLALFPSFILWSRVGIYVIAHIVAVSVGIMLAYLQWRQTGRHRWLALAALLTGLGLSTKLLFLWFMIAVPAAYALVLLGDRLAAGRGEGWSLPALARFVWARLRADLPVRSWREPAVALLAFGLTAFPVFYYNLVSLGSWRVLRANLFQTERGVNNFAFWQNAMVQADALRVFLDGGYFWFYGSIITNPLTPALTALATLALGWLVWREPALAVYRRATIFLLGFALVIFVLSWFTVSILGATHLLIMLPIPQLFLAAAAVFGARALARRWPDRRMVLTGLLLAPVLAMALVDLSVTARYHQRLTETGGHMTFSSAIYQLADDLVARGVSQPYALDWGFKYNLMLLSRGRVEPREIYGQTPAAGPEFAAAVRAALAEPAPVFLAHPEEGSAYPRLAEFRQLLAASRRRVVREEVYRQTDGRPVYHVFYIG